MRKFNKLMALILTLALCLSLAVTANAEETTNAFPTQKAHADAYITKALEVAAGTTAEAMSFDFTFAIDATQSIGLHEGETPTPNNVTITTPAVETAASENVTVMAEGKITMPEYTHAGVYVYSVKETGGTVEGVTYSKEEYTMTVGVVNSGDTLVVREIIVQKVGQNGKVTTGTSTEIGTESGGNTSTVKGNGFVFNNTYIKTAGGTGGETALTIKNAVKGAYADKTKPFTYTLTIEKNSLDSASSVKVSIAGTDETLTFDNDGKVTKTFTLKHNESFVIDSMVAGAKYTVAQVNEKDYAKTVTGSENGVIYENGVTVSYLNEYKDVTPTGFAMNNAPFMLMTGAAAMFLLLMLVSKKRREEA